MGCAREEASERSGFQSTFSQKLPPLGASFGGRNAAISSARAGGKSSSAGSRQSHPTVAANPEMSLRTET